MQRKTFVYQDVKYKQLNQTRRDDAFVYEQFKGEGDKLPIKSLCLAFFLFVCGFSLLAIGCLQVSGFIDEKYSDRTWPLLIMGTIMFLPGAYYVRIAYGAYYRLPGFSFEDIPDFD